MPETLAFVFQHACKHAPAYIHNRFAKMKALRHGMHVQVFNADHVIMICEVIGQFVQKIPPLCRCFFVQLCDFALLTLVAL